MNRIGIIGAGAWGTALSLVTQRAGREVVIWGRETEVVRSINDQATNPLFLPGVTLDRDIRATQDLGEAADAEAVLLVVPAQFVRATLADLAPSLEPGVPVVICTKGIEQDTGALMSEIVVEAVPKASIAVLSGPTFASEVARGLPTAVTLACRDASLGAALVDTLGEPRFRPYLSDDVTGAEIGGATKNVLAIACGIIAGRAMGDNARAALITRGLAEMTRLALAKEGKAETMMGLSGLGDVTLTCSSETSRNFSLGVSLGKGTALADILAKRLSVAEGVFTASSVVGLAARLGVEMPIAAAVDAVLNRGAAIDTEIEGLLARPFTTE